jgi:hypothetical protein
MVTTNGTEQGVGAHGLGTCSKSTPDASTKERKLDRLRRDSGSMFAETRVNASIFGRLAFSSSWLKTTNSISASAK